MGKRRDINLENYIEETTNNIREDRAIAKMLLMDIVEDTKKSPHERRELGAIAAKYVDNLQRSNEQMVKLASIIQRQSSEQTGLTSDDKEQLFDLLNGGSVDEQS